MADQQRTGDEAPDRPWRIVVVDDHPIVREGLEALFAGKPDLTICATAEEPDEALRVIRAQGPDLVIVDLGLARGSGLDVIERLRAAGDTVPVLVWSMHPAETHAARALEAGAQGFVEKRQASREIVRAVRSLLSGSPPVTGDRADAAARTRRDAPGGGTAVLSQRELEAFELMGQGLITPVIAQRMKVSPKTVETYRARIKHKLGLKSYTELIQRATAWVLERR